MRDGNLKYGIRNLKASILLMVVFMVSSFAASAQVDELKASADQAYIAQDYQKAIELYEEILGQDYTSAEVYYNLGNAYFKSGKIAPSVLNYERALKLAPNDEDIQFNLRLVNLSVKDKVEVIPELFFVTWWKTFLKVFTTDGWAWSAVVAFVLGLAGLLLFKLSSEEGMKRLTFYTALFALIWTALSVYAAEKNYDHVVNDKRAVIFAYTQTAKSAPNDNGKDLFVIHEGLVVTVEDNLNGWIRIKLSNGDVGWIPESAAVSI